MLSYLLSDEKPYVMMKSNKEEYIFTDCAFVAAVGTSNVGTKRFVHRYEYCEHRFTNVSLYTPGLAAADLDGILNFTINGMEHRIEIKRTEWEDAKKLYQALLSLQRTQYLYALRFATEKDILSKLVFNNATDLDHLGDAISAVAEKAVNRYHPVSYGAIFEKLQK